MTVVRKLIAEWKEKEVIKSVRVAKGKNKLQGIGLDEIVNHVVANSHLVDLGPNVEAESIVNNGLTSRHARLETADLIDVDHPLLHDSNKLARTIMEVYHRERKVKNFFRWSLSRKYD